MNPNTTYKFNKEKFKQAILFLLSQYPDKTIEGKKKLAKLLYYSDFNFFEYYEKPFTGASYRALQMGPVPDELDEILEEMNEKDISIEKKDIGMPNDVFVFSLKNAENIDFNKLTDDERNILSKVYKDYGFLRGRDLENLSHSEAPYNAVTEGEHIPYELSYYRGKTKEELVGV